MKDVIRYIETEKKKYPLCMNLNVIEEIQEKYQTIEEWFNAILNTTNGFPRLADFKYGLTKMINEGIDIENERKNTNDPFLTEKQVGRIMTEVGLTKIEEIIQSLAVESTKVDDLPKNE